MQKAGTEQDRLICHLKAIFTLQNMNHKYFFLKNIFTFII